MSETTAPRGITADEYILLADQAMQAMKNPQADRRQAARLWMVRIEMAEAMMRDPRNVAELVEKNRNDLIEQLTSDTRFFKRVEEMQTPERRETAEAFVFQGVDTARREEAKTDKVLRYALADAAFHRTLDAGMSSNVVGLCHAYRRHCAAALAEEPADLIRFGEQKSDKIYDLLVDLNQRQALKVENESALRTEAGRYLAFDRLARRMALETPVMVENMEARRREVGAKVSGNIAGLVILGDEANRNNRSVSGRFVADRVEALPLTAWGTPEHSGYNNYHKSLGDALGEEMNNPAQRYAAVQKQLQDALATGRNAAQVPFMRKLAQEAALDMQTRPDSIAELIREHPHLKEAFLRDARPGVAPFEDGATAMTPAVRLLQRLAGPAEPAAPANAPPEEAPVAPSTPAATAAPAEPQKATEKPAFKRVSDEGVYSAHRREKDEGSISGDIAAQMPRTRGEFSAWLNNPSSTFLALPLTAFSSGGSINRDLQRAVMEDPERMLRLYQNTVNAKVSLLKAGELKSEQDKAAHDRLEMGRRALAEALIKKRVMKAEESVADMMPFVSIQAKELPADKRRDPKGYIQNNDKAGRLALYKQMMVESAQTGMRHARSFTRTLDRIFGDLVDGR